VKHRAKSADDEVMTFIFPKPGRLYGVTRLSQPVIKIENINFTYPAPSARSCTTSQST